MTRTWNSALIAQAKSLASAHGFDRAGVAAAHSASDPQGAASAQRFEAWVDAGYAGEMQYLARRNEAGELLRASARTAMPWARSVLVCALNYNLDGANGQAPRSIDRADAGTGWIAKYAWTGTEDGRPVDYHDDMLRRLRAVEAGLHELADCETRCYVDTGPLLERDFAALAGIGWIGKNTCVINQELGSWLLLGVIVTSLPTEIPVAVAQAVAQDRCGSCTRCIDACPTGALFNPTHDSPTRHMDASLCIAYLTIEKKGDIAVELREKMGRQVFGCDICQDVCPWNRRAPVAAIVGLERREELVNPALEWLAGLDAAGFKREFAGSPLERTKRSRLHRNVAIAMGNSGDAAFLPQLEEWSRGEDAVLRESAAWAIQRLRPIARENSSPSASMEGTTKIAPLET
jgi:epoxyqueuosine reductase